MSPGQKTTWKRLRAVAEDQPGQALVLARGFKEPLARCAALGWVARFWPHRDFKAIAAEALQAIELADDAYEIAVGPLWPVRALLERGAYEEAAAAMAIAVKRARHISHPGRRASAMLSLLEAVKPYETALWVAPLDDLACPQNPRIHWRQAVSLKYAMMMMVEGDAEALRAAGARTETVALVEAAVAKAGRHIHLPREYFTV